MMLFEWQHDEYSPKVTLEIPNEDVSLDELLPLVEGFLKACTYVFDGTLEIVDRKDK